MIILETDNMLGRVFILYFYQKYKFPINTNVRMVTIVLGLRLLIKYIIKEDLFETLSLPFIDEKNLSVDFSFGCMKKLLLLLF